MFGDVCQTILPLITHYLIVVFYICGVSIQKFLSQPVSYFTIAIIMEVQVFEIVGENPLAVFSCESQQRG